MVARIVIAGTSSGAGKTTVASGLIAALAKRGEKPAPFKVGPDFIDPSYHALAAGRPGRNLDAFLSGPDLIAPLFKHGSHGADVAVIEGVMGLYDGASGRGELASTAHVAKLLQAPVVLVVDAAAMARSVAAIVHGYRTFDPDVNVAGVILNRVGSEAHANLLREALPDIAVLGALPRDAELEVPERHLGLVPVAERASRARAVIDRLAASIEAHCDIDALLALARSAPAVAGPAWSPGERAATAGAGRDRPRPRVLLPLRGEPRAAARRRRGARRRSTRSTTRLPDADALILAGGFPEIFGAELSANTRLREQIAAFTGPILAECGGLLYLARELDGVPDVRRARREARR